jgi:hypothetical protein
VICSRGNCGGGCFLISVWERRLIFFWDLGDWGKGWQEENRQTVINRMKFDRGVML